MPKTACKFLKTRQYRNGRWSDTFASILDCWQATKEYPQCSTGLNHNRRDVIVIDIDDSCDTISIPVSYKFQNPLSGHWQAGMVLNSPCFDKKTYIKLTHELNKICKGDPKYTGWLCKNPYHYNTEWTGLTFNFGNLYSEYCQNAGEGGYSSSSISYMKVNTLEEIGSDSGDTSSLFISYMKMNTLRDEMLSGEESRHFHIMDKVNRFVWGNECKVSIEETVNYILSINQTIGLICGKEAEQEAEVIRQVRSLYPWAVEHYDSSKRPNHIPTIEDLEYWHEKALEVRREHRDFKIDKMMELVNEFGISGYRNIKKKMFEYFELKVSLGWISKNMPCS